MEHAIKQILSTVNSFPKICKISISKEKVITFHYNKVKEKHKNKFTDAIELLVWC
ncbi:hypothetical protein [Polaribacter glomeratus]|uniref:hypothetical protein n=1 Tax=Polaribacter glomeratus TaxID=102 RepID=UPI001472EC96|nr:hypothetical protein [Polaribacter glomeratus]